MWSSRRRPQKEAPASDLEAGSSTRYLFSLDDRDPSDDRKRRCKGNRFVLWWQRARRRQRAHCARNWRKWASAAMLAWLLQQTVCFLMLEPQPAAAVGPASNQLWCGAEEEGTHLPEPDVSGLRGYQRGPMERLWLFAALHLPRFGAWHSSWTLAHAVFGLGGAANWVDHTEAVDAAKLSYVQRAFRWLLPPSSLLPRMDILDNGCDVHGLADVLLARSTTGCVAGVNVDQSFPAPNLPRRANNLFKAVDGSTVPFADGSFDAVLSAYVLEHVPVPVITSYITESLRVLKPCGVLYLHWGPVWDR